MRPLPIVGGKGAGHGTRRPGELRVLGYSQSALEEARAPTQRIVSRMIACDRAWPWQQIAR
jgi:hypothetical protein